MTVISPTSKRRISTRIKRRWRSWMKRRRARREKKKRSRWRSRRKKSRRLVSLNFLTEQSCKDPV